MPPAGCTSKSVLIAATAATIAPAIRWRRRVLIPAVWPEKLSTSALPEVVADADQAISAISTFATLDAVLANAICRYLGGRRRTCPAVRTRRGLAATAGGHNHDQRRCDQYTQRKGRARRIPRPGSCRIREHQCGAKRLTTMATCRAPREHPPRVIERAARGPAAREIARWWSRSAGRACAAPAPTETAIPARGAEATPVPAVE